jgi:hypothetical protein
MSSQALTDSPRGRIPPLARWLSVPVVAVVLIAGGWVGGGLVSSDFRLSLAITTAWVGLVGLACVVLVFKRREMWPALVSFAITATVAGAYLGTQTLVDKRVNESVATAAAPTSAAADAAPSANRLVAEGEFRSLEHGTSGVAQVIDVNGGERRVVTLTRFQTSAGPDLRVYLAPADADEDSRGDGSVDLGALKGNIGNQQYELPLDADLDRLTKVIVWCRAFSVGFGAAPLRGI